MIYFSLGLPGRLAQWCDATIGLLARQSGEAVAAMTDPEAQAPDYPLLDRAALNLIKSDASHLVIGTRQPDQKLKAVLTDIGIPFVLALEDPRVVAAQMYADGETDVQAITRTVANKCPQLMDYALLDGAYIVRAKDVAADDASVIGSIAQHLGIAIKPEQAATIAQSLRDESVGREVSGDVSSFPATEQKMVEGALAGYAAHFNGEPFGDIVWTRELFSRAADPQANLQDPVNLRDTGNGRFLIYGPYMHLPPGYWSAQIVLGISPEAAGQTLLIDAFSGQQLAATKISPRLGGVFTAGLDFALSDLSGQNVEIRILSNRDSAPGQLAFGHVVLHPISLHHGSIVAREQDDFRTVLAL